MLATAISPSINNMTYQSPSQPAVYTPMHLHQAQILQQQQQQQQQQQRTQDYVYPNHQQNGPPIYQSPPQEMRQAPSQLTRQEPLTYHRLPNQPQPLYPAEASQQYQTDPAYTTQPAQPNGAYGFRFPQEMPAYNAMHSYAPVYADTFANASAGPSDYRGWDDEGADGLQEFGENGEVMYNPMEVHQVSSSNESTLTSHFNGTHQVKHRRRTTPEQFRVLEESFLQNPKPSNQHRKALADMLGMTTRGVQVWFQNRRAKAKATAKKEREAQRTLMEDHLGPQGYMNPSPLETGPGRNQLTPFGTRYGQNPSPIDPNGTQHYMPPPTLGAVGRRVSLGAPVPVASVYDETNSPRRPALGSAAEARRGSLPYPTPVTAPPQRTVQPGPVPPSPSGRHLPAHLMGMRAGRRASLPTGAMTISSGPFTPPRVGNIHPLTVRTPVNGLTTGYGQISPANKRELSPIADHEQLHDATATSKQDRPRELKVQTALSYQGSSLQTPLSAQFTQSSSSYDNVSPEAIDDLVQSQYTLSQGPLPNPTFSFGSAMPPPDAFPQGDTSPFSNDQMGPMYDFTKARFGSIASIETSQTDATENGSGSEWGMPSDWMTQVNLSQIFEDGGVDLNAGGFMTVPQGFHPDARRASAPADLLHNFAFLGVDGLRGLTANSALGHAHRPSPLNQGFSADGNGLAKVPEQSQFDKFSDNSTGPSPVEVQINGVAAGDLEDCSIQVPQAYLSPSNSDLAPSPHSVKSSHSLPQASGSQALSVDQFATRSRSAGAEQWDQLANDDGDIFSREQDGLFDP